MSDKPESVACYFWDKSSDAGRSPNSKCGKEASGFVRKAHDNRLCPLCDSCKETFQRAEKEMDPKVKKSIPGHGAFTEVALSPESIAEFQAQPAKKTT